MSQSKNKVSKILVTGSEGFIAKNLIVRLKELKSYELIAFSKQDQLSHMGEKLKAVDFVFHLAGVNRPKDESEFIFGNRDLTKALIEELKNAGRSVPIVFSSSTQALLANPYGQSKKDAEDLLLASGLPAAVFRLPNVFGKWSKPNYNSAVATFCHRIARGEEIQINDANAQLNLVYVDDVINSFMGVLKKYEDQGLTAGLYEVPVVYKTTVGEVAQLIRSFPSVRSSLVTEPVGTGLVRALYSTFISFLPESEFGYTVPRYADPRGVFVEMLKTKDAGQFSFFTAHHGITRGGHYHHTKTEKFLVITGQARYRFRHILTGQIVEFVVDGDHESRIVDTIPGWAHDITNVGTTPLVVMLWANEIFDRQKPDTIGHEV